MMNNPGVRVIDPGHVYELDNLPAEHNSAARLVFLNKKEVDGELKLVHEGVTTEGVLNVVLDRLDYLENRLPSEFNRAAIAHVEQALKCLEARTADRQGRGVEGTSNQ